MKPSMLIMLPGLALVASGCLSQPVRTNPEPEPPPSPDGIRLTLWETLPSRELRMYARTERQYACFNYTIETMLQRSGAGFGIEYSSIVTPNICLTAIGPATSLLTLGALAEGRHALRIGGIAGNADLVLEVGPGSYDVLGSSDPGIRFDEISLRRIPDGVVWGYFGYARKELEAETEAVLTEIKALGATDVRLPAGTYHAELSQQHRDRFRVTPSGTLEQENLGYYFQRAFALDYTGDRNDLRDLVYRVGARYGDEFHLRVFTSKGDVFLSWYPVN